MSKPRFFIILLPWPEKEKHQVWESVDGPAVSDVDEAVAARKDS